MEVKLDMGIDRQVEISLNLLKHTFVKYLNWPFKHELLLNSKLIF